MTSRLPRSAALAVGLVAAALAVLPSSAGAFSLGFNEPGLAYATPSDQRLLVARMRDVNADRVRIDVVWNEVAIGGTVAPDDAVAADPAWPGYRWDGLDSAIAQATAAGLVPMLVVERAPRWAEGEGRPDYAPPGSWRPSPARLAAFMTAMARRYSGAYVPAGAAAPLPAVRLFQVWNEPNLDGQLLPQHVERDGRTVPVVGDIYREMLTASYVAIKRVSAANTVIAAGLAPYGDYPAGQRTRTPPLFFARQLLCLSSPSSGCDHPARFDVFAVNVYPPAPGTHARNADDLALADIGRIRSLLSRAAARRTVRAPSRPPLWVTEFSWATKKPDYSYVVGTATQARYLVEGLYRLWGQGVQVAFWWRLRDGDQKLGYQVHSGFFSRASSVSSDKPKPIVAAAKLPFLVSRVAGGFRAWALPFASGTLTIERGAGKRWVKLATVRAVSRKPVLRRLAVKPGQRLRARLAGAVSLPWTVR